MRRRPGTQRAARCTCVYFVAFVWFAFDLARTAVTDSEVGGLAWAHPTPVVVEVTMLLGILLMIGQILPNIRHDLQALGSRD